MELLDLPLDCFRYILTYIARDFDFHDHGHEFLRLRLTNRMMATEVLRALQRPAWYQWKRKVRTLETAPFFKQWSVSVPSLKKRAPVPSSYLDFFSSFLLLRPHTQDPWNANISSILNRVVDALLTADGLDITYESRKPLMAELCHHIFELKHWKTQPGCFAECLFPRSQTTWSNETESLDFNLLLANVLLGRRTSLEDQDVHALMGRSSNIFGTLLQACIKGGQVGLAALLLDTGIDVHDESLAVLETAAVSDNRAMLELIFSTKYGFSVPTMISRVERTMQKAIENDHTEAVLYILEACDTAAIHLNDITFALGHACCHNNHLLAEALFKSRKELEHARTVERIEWIVPPVVFYGHQDMVKFLERRNFLFVPKKMMYSVSCSGDVSMLRFLLREYPITLELSEWRDLLANAVVRETARHQDFIATVLSDPSIVKQRLSIAEHDPITAKSLFQCQRHEIEPLFIAACNHGNTFLIQKMVEAGGILDWVPDKSSMSPVLAARIAGQQAIVDILLAHGAEDIDPLETKYKERFESGDLPRKHARVPTSVDTCFWWI